MEILKARRVPAHPPACHIALLTPHCTPCTSACCASSSFTPANSGTTAAPIVGLSLTETHFLITGTDTTRSVPFDFTGNNQDANAFDNYSSGIIDAANGPNNTFYQLSNTNVIRQVSTNKQALVANLGEVYNAFGIGYDGVSDTLAVGTFDPASAILGLTLYPHVSLGQNLQPSLHLTIPFDPSQWGTPSGIDYHNHRFLVATRDWMDIHEELLFNHVLDIDARSGRIDQYFWTLGHTNKLNDILYDPATQSILLGYQSGVVGGVEHGPYPGLWAGRHGLAVGGMEGGEAVLSLHGLEWRAAYRIHASADLHAWQPSIPSPARPSAARPNSASPSTPTPHASSNSKPRSRCPDPYTQIQTKRSLRID